MLSPECTRKARQTAKEPAEAGEDIVLVLQGGGALGAYQAGAYERLAACGLAPGWIAGISVGAINAAIIAGNRAEDRVARLREFWNGVSSGLLGDPFHGGTEHRENFNRWSAAWVASVGVPGFFRPRVPPAVMMPDGSPEALSFYDASPLRETLEQLVDFDRLNDGPIRVSVGAVNVLSGNFAYFDSENRRIGPEHIMASAALPPGLAPVVIEGAPYWDGGVVSNAPLQYILDYSGLRGDACIFQVDLFNARGAMPSNLLEVAQREKEIRYSSRTRLHTDSFRETQKLRRIVRRWLDKLPAEIDGDPDAEFLREFSCDSTVTIVHLILRRTAYQTHAQDYEFSRLSIEEHWQAGGHDVSRTLRHPAWRDREKPKDGIAVLDLSRDEMG